MKTIVLMSPMRAAIRAAASADTAARMLAPKKIAPRTGSGSPNRSWNQNASRLWTISPPPKASSANSAASRSDDAPATGAARAAGAIDVSTGGTSTAGETVRTIGHEDEPAHRVADEDHAVGVDARDQPAPRSAPTDQARDERARSPSRPSR